MSFLSIGIPQSVVSRDPSVRLDEAGSSSEEANDTAGFSFVKPSDLNFLASYLCHARHDYRARTRPTVATARILGPCHRPSKAKSFSENPMSKRTKSLTPYKQFARDECRSCRWSCRRRFASLGTAGADLTATTSQCAGYLPKEIGRARCDNGDD